MGEEKTVKKTRSFRDEDYNNRRVFLRSYPLQWEEDGEEEAALEAEKEEEKKRQEEEEEEDEVVVCRFSVKSKFMAFVHWSEGKMVLLRRLKKKVVFYLVSCHSFGFKSSSKLITF